MKVLLLDVDGVIANFGQYYLDIVEKKLGHKFTIQDLIEWNYWDVLKLSKYEKQIIDNELRASGCASRLEPYPDAIDGVKALMEVVDVRFVTAPLRGNPTWVYDRGNWLRGYFGSTMADNTIYTDNKELVFGHAFVDDKMSNLDDWAKRNSAGIPVMFVSIDNEEKQIESKSIVEMINEACDNEDFLHIFFIIEPKYYYELFDKVNSFGLFSFYSVITNKNNILEKLSKHENLNVRYYVARNPNCPIEILEKLSANKDIRIVSGVVENPNCSNDILDKLCTAKNVSILTSLAGNPNCPSEILEKIIKIPDVKSSAIINIIANKNCTDNIRFSILKDNSLYGITIFKTIITRFSTKNLKLLNNNNYNDPIRKEALLEMKRRRNAK